MEHLLLLLLCLQGRSRDTERVVLFRSLGHGSATIENISAEDNEGSNDGENNWTMVETKVMWMKTHMLRKEGLIIVNILKHVKMHMNTSKGWAKRQGFKTSKDLKKGNRENLARGCKGNSCVVMLTAEPVQKWPRHAQKARNQSSSIHCPQRSLSGPHHTYKSHYRFGPFLVFIEADCVSFALLVMFCVRRDSHVAHNHDPIQDPKLVQPAPEGGILFNVTDEAQLA